MSAQEVIAAAIEAELERNGLDDMGFDIEHAAAAVLAALELREERRVNAKCSGVLIDHDGTEHTYRSDIRYDRRLVGPWTPLEATESDVPTPSVQRTAEETK